MAPQAETAPSAAGRKPWSLVGLVVTGSIAALILGGVLGQTFAWLVAERGSWLGAWGRLSSAELYDVVRTDVAAVALIAAGGAALIAYRRQRTAEDQHSLEGRRHALAEQADLRERYTSAAEQIGHERAAVRLAGVYAMAQLADEWARRADMSQLQVCIDVLCAYLRMPPTDEEDLQEQEVRTAVVSVLRQHLQNPDSATSWCAASLDLSGARLSDADFTGATFAGSKVSFARALFSGERVTFEGASFDSERATFDRASFWTDLASFDGARLGGTMTFAEADFPGELVSFYRARLGGVSVDFSQVNFTGELVSFDGVDVLGRSVCFNQANLSCQRLVVANAKIHAESALDFSAPAVWASTIGALPPPGVLLPAWAPSPAVD